MTGENDHLDDPRTPLALLRGLAGAIPVVGGALGELLTYIAVPIDRLRELALHDVAAALQEASQRYGRTPDELLNDDNLVALLLQVNSSLVTTRNEHKRRALRAALVSGANPNRQHDDAELQLLRFVQDLSGTHLRLLACVQDHADEFGKAGNLDAVYQLATRHLGELIPRPQFRSYLSDLAGRFLIHLGDTADFPEYETGASYIVAESSATRPLVVTPLGEDLLQWIGHPNPPHPDAP